MSSRKEGNRSGLRRRTTPPRVEKVRKLKKARSSDTSAFLPARYGVKFPPGAAMDHRVILEIPSWTRRKLDKGLEKLRVEQGIESSVDLSTNNRIDLPLLSRPIISAPGREFEMTLGSNPPSPQLVDDASTDPQAGPSAGTMSTDQPTYKETLLVESAVVSVPSDLPLIITVSSSEDDS